MKAPGTAYDNDLFGKDPQPAHMDQFQILADNRFGDFGGVHINSGIPNRAFYLVASSIGGKAWDAPGHIWYETLTKNCGPDSQFQDFADATFGVAGRLYGASGREQVAVRDAWREVGILVKGASSIAADRVTSARDNKGADYESLAELRAKVDALAKKVDQLSKRVK